MWWCKIFRTSSKTPAKFKACLQKTFTGNQPNMRTSGHLFGLENHEGKKWRKNEPLRCTQTSNVAVFAVKKKFNEIAKNLQQLFIFRESFAVPLNSLRRINWLTQNNFTPWVFLVVLAFTQTSFMASRFRTFCIYVSVSSKFWGSSIELFAFKRTIFELEFVLLLCQGSWNFIRFYMWFGPQV